MRTFIAIDLDETIKDRIQEFISELDQGDRSIKWVKRHAMHITLSFLGDISSEKVKDVSTALRSLTQNHDPFSLNIKGIGYFPQDSNNPKVIWVGIKSPPDLLSIHASVWKEMEKLGFTPEKRLFHPHVTLGRIKKPHGLNTIRSRLNLHTHTEFGQMTADKIKFLQSTLTPSGSEYSTIYEGLL